MREATAHAQEFARMRQYSGMTSERQSLRVRAPSDDPDLLLRGEQGEGTLDVCARIDVDGPVVTVHVFRVADKLFQPRDGLVTLIDRRAF
jgi:hypothetical protein